ncbi:MAG: hypothetical protein V7607_1345 [Solirubrobacteraceae bacterium]
MTSGHRSRTLRTLLVAAACGLLPATAAAAPGTPGTPQAASVVYADGFENGVGATPILLTGYTGATGETYTADPAWLSSCNGAIVEFASPDAAQGSSGCSAAGDYGRVRQLAYALGVQRGAADPTTNHAVTAYTEAPNPGVDRVQFETLSPIPLAASGRFITFSVDATEVNCFANHARFKFYLLNGATEIPTFTVPIDPCTDPGAQTISVPAVGTAGAVAVRTGTYAGNSAVLFGGSALGIRMRNGQGSATGNDAAFDSVRVLDATPQLDKSFSPAIVEVGQSSTLTFTITNTSDLAAKNGWSFTDSLPSGLVVANPSGAATTCSAGQVTAAAGGGSVAVTGNLTAGQASCTVSVSVTSARAGTYTNGAGNVTPVGINPPGSASVTFQTADVSIVKTVSDKTPALGDTVTYTLAVHNGGPADARNVAIGDTAAAGIAPISATPSQGTCSSPSVCQLGTLPAGGNATVTVTARTAAEGTAANTATVASSTPDSDQSNNTSSQTIDVHPSADLKIVKTASVTTVHEGQDFRYTLAVTNAGPSTARAATVTDSLPAGVALRSASSSTGSCGQGDPVVCGLGDIASGGKVTITLDVTATGAGRPENTAIAESPTPDPDLADNSDHTAVTTDRLADLAITKSASTPVVADGEAFDYTLKVVNHGPSRAIGSVVTDAVPGGLRIQAAFSSRGTCTATGQTIACDLGDLGSGGTATITVTVLTTKAGSYTNTASVTSEVPDPKPANNLDSASVEVSARADVGIVKTASVPTALVGDTVTYGLTVSNSGPDDAADVTVTDPLPAGGVFVAAKPSAGTCSTAAGSLVCDLGSLANGAAVTIQLRVTLTEAGDTRNVAQVTTSTPDPKPSNNQSATSSTTEQADVALTKATSTPRPSIGQTVTYTITARNAGPALARGVVVTDPIPASLKYVGAKPSAGSCAVAQDALICNVGDIAPGRSATVTLRAIVRRVGDAGNAASAVSRYPDDPNTANNLARAVVKAPAAHLALRKTVSRSSISTGGHVTFQLRVRNTGDSSAHSVLVCDRMPPGLVAASSSPKARLRDGSYCWTLTSLAPGGSKRLTITATALSRASGRRINRATVNARDARPATATRAVTIHRIRVLGGGVTG